MKNKTPCFDRLYNIISYHIIAVPRILPCFGQQPSMRGCPCPSSTHIFGSPRSRGIAGVLSAALLLVVLANLGQIFQPGGRQNPQGNPGAHPCWADPVGVQKTAVYTRVVTRPISCCCCRYKSSTHRIEQLIF